MRVLATGAFQFAEANLRIVPVDGYELSDCLNLLEPWEAAEKYGSALFEDEELDGPRAILTVGAAGQKLAGPDGVSLVGALACEGHYVLGLMPGGGTLGPGLEPIDGGWRIGQHTLTSHPLPPYPARGWAWGVSTGVGPIMLNVYLDRTRAELERWLAGFAPVDYQPKGGGIYEAFDTKLFLGDGLVQFLRGYHRPSELRDQVDSTLLASLASETLGPVTWDGFDADYVSFHVTGHDAASLLDYLRRDGPGKAHFNHGLASVERRLDGDPAEVIRWVRETPLHELPRHILAISPQALSEEIRHAIALANPRILWRFRAES